MLTEELPGMPIERVAPLPGNIVVILDQANTYNTAGFQSVSLLTTGKLNQLIPAGSPFRTSRMGQIIPVRVISHLAELA